MNENVASFQTKALINGAWLPANDGTTFDVTNPLDDSVIAQVANCGREETEQAIAAASAALDAWAKLPAKQKAILMRKWFDLVTANTENLARLLTVEQGKPLAEAKGEIAYGASYIEWFAEETKRIYGDVIPSPGPDKRTITIKQPVGVVACITPWNFPNAMLARKIAPAIAAGCTVVCKPANETPLSALAMAYYAQEAGIPDGVINVLCGKTSEIGETLTGSKAVRKLTFTGSTAVGKKLTADCAATMKRTTMELGGNAPFIVFADADISSAINGLIASKFRNSGQTCVCANRIFVQDGIYDAFAARLTEAAAAMKVGNGMEDDVEQGPIIDGQGLDKIERHVADARPKGPRC